MSRYNAFVFDMNGTMIDDMRYHEDAWHHILVNQLHANLSREEVKHQLYGKNEELFERIFGAGKFSKEEADAIASQKEARYREEYLSQLALIKGLDALILKARENNIQMAIGTAAIPLNVDFVLDNLHIRPFFPVIITADDVSVSKPHPDVFLKAAEKLGVAPGRCLVFEDSPKGIEAARRAGMRAVAITSYHTAEELANDNVICAIADYSDAALEGLIW
jgi:HAD superfamily hydrolase (TIGR01509 family)